MEEKQEEEEEEKNPYLHIQCMKYVVKVEFNLKILFSYRNFENSQTFEIICYERKKVLCVCVCVCV